MDRGALRRLGAAASVIATFSLLPGAARAEDCGLLALVAPCAHEPAPLYPPAEDPGGDEQADLSVPPPAGRRFGFNTNLWWQSRDRESLVPFEVDRSAQAGARLIRTTVTWSAFASSPERPLGNEGYYYPQRGSLAGDHALARLDDLYDRATARGIQLVLVINDAPKWASAYAGCQPLLGRYFGRCAVLNDDKRLYPTAAHLHDLASFVSALGQRYPGAIFETWNEPNLDQGEQAVGGDFVGRMQCAVWQAAQALPERGLVLSAAFGDFYGEDATRRYMRGFYSTGGACFDRLSVHTYNGSSASFGAGSPLAGHMKVYRDARAEAGDTRPMWVTEFGFSTGRSSVSVSEGEQADLLRREYRKLLTMPDVEAALSHTLRDAPLPGYSSPSHPDYGYGWLREDGTPKPVYCDFSALAGDPACPAAA